MNNGKARAKLKWLSSTVPGEIQPAIDTKLTGLQTSISLGKDIRFIAILRQN
jgi:hypothetical protein